MNLKYVDYLGNISDKSVLIVIEAIQRRLDKNIDNAETRALLVERQEVLIMEAEKRGLNINE